ncbi:MAG: cell wall-binding repeat-containing protein [Tetrasphaera sp.]|nr:cell wall-binding repeat-containing protein [Tetrasphaera sp.]
MRLRFRRRLPLVATALAVSAATAVTGGSPATASESSPAPAPGLRSAAFPDKALNGHLVRPASELGAASAPKAGARRTSGARAAGGKYAGEHRIYYLPVSWTTSEPSQDPSTNADTYVGRADSYWHDVSGGSVDVTLGWADDWWRIHLSSAEVATCDRKAIWREASALIEGGGGDFDHVLVNLPKNPACDWVDVEYFGPTSAGYGLTMTNGVYVPKDDVINRAMMHNNWVLSTDQTMCKDSSGKPVPISGDCSYRLYVDPWSPLSDQPFGYTRTGFPHARELLDFGVFGSDEWTTVTPGDLPQTVTLQRLQAPGNGTQVLGFTIDGSWYDIEYRAAVGRDDWIDNKTYTDSSGVTRTTPGGGVTLVRTRIPVEQPDGSTLVWDGSLVDFHPRGTSSSYVTERHPGLEPGESYTAPDGLFKISVISANLSSARVEISFPGLRKVARWSGKDRYAASVEMSQQSFAPGVDRVLIASGEVYTDALSGAPVGGRDGDPILLTKADELPSVVEAELRRLDPASVVILGGPATISDRVASRLASVTGVTPQRWSGADRFVTSAQISERSYEAGGVDTAYVASGRVFPDALSGAPASGKAGGPVLLVDTDELPSEIAAELRRLSPRRIVVLGGTATIATGVETQLRGLASSVERWAGPDRYATAVEVTKHSYDPGVGTAYIASGLVFADALSGAPIAGMTKGPILLTDTAKLPSVVAAELERLKPKRIVVLGGANTITYAQQAQLGRYVVS